MFDIFKALEKKPTQKTTPLTHIVAGLGNPGVKYAFTRHNAGFLAVDYIAQRTNVKVDRIKFKSLSGEMIIDDVRVLILKPQTFMNNSGAALREAADFYKITPENIIVITDDTSFQPGKMRIRRKGSDGGHNGLRDIILQLNTDAFPRIKLGVGAKPHPDYNLADWVLSELSEDDKKALFSCFESVYNSISLILKGNIDQAMNQYNK
ncbi:MAG: aminoacyl-tRNA hydrolase [Clostridiales bacterium]|nr:aminoacyl-tRNA hydrolase [Clostridiales bacterium]